MIMFKNYIIHESSIVQSSSPVPVFQSSDWRHPNSGTKQTKFGNVYYHCTPECVSLHCSFFVPSDLQVPPDTAEQLTEAHKEHLTLLFGLQL